MATLDQGKGPPLFLLHGFTRTAESHWTETDRRQFSGYRLLAPDLRGHGHTPSGSEPLSHPRLAQDILRLCQVLQIDRAHFVGFSSGGMLLYDLVKLAPGLIHTMTVIAAGIYVQESAREKIMKLADPERNRNYRSTVEFLNQLHQPGQGPGYGPVIMQHWLRLTEPPGDPHRSDAELEAIRVPVLLVHGDRDPYFPLSQIRHAHRLIPDSRLLVLPDSGHFVRPATAERLLYPALQQFLQKHPL